MSDILSTWGKNHTHTHRWWNMRTTTLAYYTQKIINDAPVQINLPAPRVPSLQHVLNYECRIRLQFSIIMCIDCIMMVTVLILASILQGPGTDLNFLVIIEMYWKSLFLLNNHFICALCFFLYSKSIVFNVFFKDALQ